MTVADNVPGGEELLDLALATCKDNWSTASIPERVSRPDYDRAFAVQICELAFEKCGTTIDGYKKMLADFVHLSEEFVRLQIELDRDGKYKYSSFEEVRAIVYDNPDVMEGRYLNGLLISQALWMNHRKIYEYFVDDFCGNNAPSGTVLEVPTGTGVYITEFASRNPQWKAQGVDLSASSVAFTREIARLRRCTVNVSNENILEYSDGRTYDRLVCGELVEHLEQPEELLQKLASMMSPQSKLFLTTAIWAANIDHIYLFTTTQEVRDMLEKYFAIESELVLPVFDNKGPEDAKTPINYASILVTKAS
jgi:2-polyprenyl-3-methyl-5-hydroxy-6-metoxy-1,4-benzoquinol methylase